jgi:phage nucleotide-binding protein
MSMPDDRILQELSKYEEAVDIADSPLYFKGTIYGDGGVGKTVISCRLGKTYLFSADDGWAVLKNDFPFDLDVKKVESQGPGHLQAIAQAFRYKAPGYDTYDTIVIDPLSGLVEDYLGWLLKEVDLPKRSVGSYKDKKKAAELKLRPLESSGFDDYNQLKIYFTPIIRDLIRAPVNVIFITHERDPDFMGQNSKILPDLPDKIYKLCVRYTHATARMTRENGKRYLTMETNNKFAAKSRIQALDGKKVTDEEFIAAITKWRNQ